MPSATAQPSSGAHRARTYLRRTPERSVLHRLVQEHLATWLALREEDPSCQVTAHAKCELRAYLECGILAHGFCARPPSQLR